MTGVQTCALPICFPVTIRDADVDISPEEYRFLLRDLTIDELIEETSTDENYSLTEYLERWV